MTDETPAEKIARIDANVQVLVSSMPSVHKKLQELENDSEVNKRDHKLALWVGSILGAPIVLWVCKKMGIPSF